MSVLAVGISHRSADLRVLERATVPAGGVDKVLDEFMRCENIVEAALVTTCNRVEVYTVVQAFHAGLAEVVGVLSRHSGLDVAELYDHLYVHYAGSAAEHLFRVSSGLDSMVIGEAQILGQVRTAYNTARAAGTAGRTLHELFQRALRVGKRVHTETDLDAAGGSVVSEALADAQSVLGGLTGRRALIVGAGSMGGLSAAALRRAGIGEIVIANRTEQTGARLAELQVEQGTPARAVGLDDLTTHIASADVVVSCTGATATVIDEGMITARTKPLVVCDLGLPRDVAAEVASLSDVTIVDLVSLQRRLAESPTGLDTNRAVKIVSDEVGAYLATQRSAEVTPTVTALRRRAAEVVDAELLRLNSRLDLDQTSRAEVAQTVRRVVDKLLHTPTVRVKELASGPNGVEYAEALRELFQLNPTAPSAIATAPATSTRATTAAASATTARTSTLAGPPAAGRTAIAGSTAGDPPAIAAGPAAAASVATPAGSAATAGPTATNAGSAATTGPMATAADPASAASAATLAGPAATSAAAANTPAALPAPAPLHESPIGAAGGPPVSTLPVGTDKNAAESGAVDNSPARARAKGTFVPQGSPDFNATREHRQSDGERR